MLSTNHRLHMTGPTCLFRPMCLKKLVEERTGHGNMHRCAHCMSSVIHGPFLKSGNNHQSSHFVYKVVGYCRCLSLFKQDIL